MLEKLDRLRLETGQDRLIPILHISCFDTAKLILWILQLCVPAFKTSLSDWFVTLREAERQEGVSEGKYNLPDGMDMNSTYCMGKGMLNSFTGIMGLMWADAEEGVMMGEVFLSQDGELLNSEYVPMGNTRPIIIKKRGVEQIAGGLYPSVNDKSVPGWEIRLISNITHAVMKQCVDSHPDLCAQIATITDKVDFGPFESDEDA